MYKLKYYLFSLWLIVAIAVFVYGFLLDGSMTEENFFIPGFPWIQILIEMSGWILSSLLHSYGVPGWLIILFWWVSVFINSYICYLTGQVIYKYCNFFQKNT